MVVTLVAGVLRFVGLGQPHAVVFDETYYVKDGLALWRFGFERGAIEDANGILLGQHGAWDTLDIFTDQSSFVVHPPLGKWTIGPIHPRHPDDGSVENVTAALEPGRASDSGAGPAAGVSSTSVTGQC